MSKKSFILYTDTLEVLDEMTDEEAGQLFRAIKEYQDGNEPDMDRATRIAFSSFRKQFQRDEAKYEEVAQRNRENGQKGGRPSEPRRTQKNPEEPGGFSQNPEEPTKTQKNPENLDSDSGSGSDSVRESGPPLSQRKNSPSKKEEKKGKQGSLPVEASAQKEKSSAKKEKRSKLTDLGYFDTIWEEWLEYKATEKKDTYKHSKYEKKAFDKLLELSNNSPEEARKIVDQSIMNGWKGLFPNKNQSKNNGKADTNKMDRYRKAIAQKQGYPSDAGYEDQGQQ